MNKILVFTIIFLGIFQESPGQVFWFSDFDLAIKNSFKTGKKVLVECYHPECTHCITLNENLKSIALAQYLNENYTNFKIDLSNQQQVSFLVNKNIRLLNYPIFLFFDNDGKLIYFIEPKETPQEIIQQFEEERGNSCVECENKVDPSIKDNVKCATFYRLLKDHQKSNAICTKFINELPSEEKLSLNSWNVFKKVVLSTNNAFFENWINNSATAASFENNTNKEKDTFYTIINWQLDHLRSLSVFEKSNLDAIRKYLAIIGGDEKRINTLLWDLELAYFISQKDFIAASEVCNKLFEFYPDASTYNFLMEKIHEKLATNEMHFYFLSIKEKWLAAAKDNTQKLQFYKNSAIFYGKNKENVPFLNALEMASKVGLPESEKVKLISSYLK